MVQGFQSVRFLKPADEQIPIHLVEVSQSCHHEAAYLSHASMNFRLGEQGQQSMEGEEEQSSLMLMSKEQDNLIQTHLLERQGNGKELQTSMHHG